MSQNLSSAAVVIGALRVNSDICIIICDIESLASNDFKTVPEKNKGNCSTCTFLRVPLQVVCSKVIFATKWS